MVAIVLSVSLPWVNTTGIVPVRPTAAAPTSPAPPVFSARVWGQGKKKIAGDAESAWMAFEMAPSACDAVGGKRASTPIPLQQPAQSELQLSTVSIRLQGIQQSVHPTHRTTRPVLHQHTARSRHVACAVRRECMRRRLQTRRQADGGSQEEQVRGCDARHEVEGSSRASRGGRRRAEKRRPDDGHRSRGVRLTTGSSDRSIIAYSVALLGTRDEGALLARGSAGVMCTWLQVHVQLEDADPSGPDAEDGGR